jgi:hypothetical protein
MARCYRPSCPSYPRYGGGGVTVCPEWHSFQGFLRDMGKRPTALHSLDRIDNEGNYEPGNCRWATSEEQQNNTRANTILEWNGRRQSATAWAREMGINEKTIFGRLRKGWSIERCLAKSPICPPAGKKLDPEQVCNIKTALRSGEKGHSIARRYRIDPTTISKIKLGRIWRDVE